MARKYFIRKDGEQLGPFTLDELADAGVTPDTYVWAKGMSDWTRARSDAEICRMFRQRLFHVNEPEKKDDNLPAEADKVKRDIDKTAPGFGFFVNQDGGPVEPYQEEKPDLTVEPRSRVVEAILVTLFCSVIGFVAIYYAFAARKAWKAGNAELSYDLTRKAKMWTGISFFIGMICTAFMLRQLL